MQATTYNGTHTVYMPSLCKECFVMRHDLGHSDEGSERLFEKAFQVFLCEANYHIWTFSWLTLT